MKVKTRNAAPILLIFTLLALAGGAVHWSYDGPSGPEHWGDLSHDYILCAEGLQQSPINISSDVDDDDDMDELDFSYDTSTQLNLIHNGHTVKANVPPGAGSLTIGSQTYNLLQFHFHTPSEHLLDGYAFPLEMHLVHASSAGELAVVGVFLEVGCGNNALAPIFSNLPQHEDENNWVSQFNLNTLLPENQETYRYAGSLTTPPCSEGVRWHVMAEPMSISSDQAGNFISLFSGAHFPLGNSRPVLPLNGRKVILAE